MAGSPTALNQALKDAFNDKEYSDITVKCGEHEFRVHKVIVCNQSAFFKSAFHADMRERATNEIRLDEYEACVIYAMLSSLYTCDYPDTISNELDKLPPLVLHAKIYAAAVQYQIKALQKLAKEKFERAANARWKEEEFSEAVRIVFESTPAGDRGLRDVVVEISALHIHALLDAGTAFSDLILTHPTFAADMTFSLARKLRLHGTYR